VVVLDSRAVVLEKVGRVKDALLDARAIIELTPKSPKVSPDSAATVLLFRMTCTLG
jgi:hypothetical protein